MILYFKLIAKAGLYSSYSNCQNLNFSAISGLFFANVVIFIIQTK